MNLEEKIATFIDDVLKVESIEEAFNLYIVHQPKLEQAKQEQRKDQWFALLSESNSDQSESALKIFVNSAANPARNHIFNHKDVEQDVLLHLLEVTVRSKIAGARQVCDALLHSEHLKPSRTDFWIAAFRLVRKIIGGVDYKGVREIMKHSIEKVTAMMPSTADPALENQVQVVRELLAYIFDRNAALLPGYFIVNEILKTFPEKPYWPHWTIAPMMSDFFNSFRPTAQMVSSTLKHRMRPIVEQTGKAHQISSWKIEPTTLKFLLIRNLTYDRILPYAKELVEPQRPLLSYILRQLSSKELVNSVLGVQKPRKDLNTGLSPAMRYPLLEEELVNLFIEAMIEVEDWLAIHPELDANLHLLWWNLSSELIFFLIYQFVTFPTFVDSVYKALQQKHISKRPMKEGRDFLMWTLLQFISGSIGKNTWTDFMPVLKLYSLYNETSPLPVPKGKNAVRKLSAASIYIHLSRKMSMQMNTGAGGDDNQFQFVLPVALRSHYEYLRNLGNEKDLDVGKSVRMDFKVAILCNTFSTAQDFFQVVLSDLLKVISGGSSMLNTSSEGSLSSYETIPMAGSSMVAYAATQPLSMEILDMMSVHAKMSLIGAIVSNMCKQVNNKSNVALAPALVETYCRLLVFSEIESLGIKGLLNREQLLPLMFKPAGWAILHVVLEMFSYRLHYIQAQFRLSLLSHLQANIMGSSHHITCKHPQLNICMESTILRLITGLGNAEITTPRNSASSTAGSAGAGNATAAASAAQKTSVLYGDSEELNRVVVLTLARAIHIHGYEQQSTGYFKEILTSIMNKTPHSWPSHTLADFPPILRDFYNEHPVARDNRQTLMQSVEEEYRTWTSMSDEGNKIAHFSSPNNTLFLCVLWKVLLVTDNITAVAYKVLDRIGTKQLTAHLRSFCDVLVMEFAKSHPTGHVNKCIDAMNNLIWKYNIIALDRLILCMALRTNEGNDAQVSFFIIQLLLLKPQDFRNRVSGQVRNMSPEHWINGDFYAHHMEFHRKFPEKFIFGEGTSGGNSEFQHLPVYFSNVCLRFIPVFDLVVHRFLELPQLSNSLETLIDHIGVLYKFHDRPITYLYNTLHYYEHRIRERHTLKRTLVSSIVGSLKEVRPAGWCLTEDYLQKLDSTPREDGKWNLGMDYYVRLIGRLVRSMQGKFPFPHLDWRFNEFPNESTHALYVTCVEIMGLPISDPAQVGANLVDVILEAHHLFNVEDLPDWINAVGLLLSYLPDVFLEGLKQRLVSAISSPPLSQWNLPQNPFEMFDFNVVHSVSGSTLSSKLSRLLAVAHALFHHAGFIQIQQLPELVREKFLPIVRTEEQLLFVYHLVGPFLQRLQNERYTRHLIELTVQLYRMLGKVDKEMAHLRFMDYICDLLYHVKYQFTGDAVRADAEKIVKDLRPALQLRLRFISPGIIPSQQQTNGK